MPKVSAAAQRKQIIDMLVHNDDNLAEAVLKLEPDVYNRALGRATTAAIKPVVAQAAANLYRDQSIDTGTLLDSLGPKKKTYKRSRVVLQMVGARKGFKRPVRQVRVKSFREAWRTGQSTRIIYRNPVNYLHLVEGGFTTRDGRKIKGTEFLSEAFEKNETRMVSELKKVVAKAVVRSWNQHAKKGEKK